MKKIFILALTVALGILLFVGCGGSGANGGSEESVAKSSDTTSMSVSLEDLAKEITEASKFTDMIKVEPNVVELQHKIDTEEYTSDLCVYLHATGLISDEVFLAEAKDDSSADEIVSKLESYVESRIEQYEGYAPEEMPKLEDSKIIKKGNYVMLLVAEDTAPGVSAFENSF